MMVPMDRYTINKCGLAYIFYLFIALFLILAVALDIGALGYDLAGGWMIVIALWMASLALLAAPAGLLLSLLLWRHWLSEWGVIALPLLLVLWIGVFAYEEARSGPFYWLNIVTIAYVILAIAVAARWFLYSRMRAAELAGLTQDSSKVTAGRVAVQTGLALFLGGILGVAPGKRIAELRQCPRDTDIQPDGPDRVSGSGTR